MGMKARCFRRSPKSDLRFLTGRVEAAANCYAKAGLPSFKYKP